MIYYIFRSSTRPNHLDDVNKKHGSIKIFNSMNLTNIKHNLNRQPNKHEILFRSHK